MYYYILCFQTVCIIVSGVCLYLVAADKGFRSKKHYIPVSMVLAGIFSAEAGYGMYLQEITLGGLQTAEKFFLMGKLAAAVGLFMTCVSLSDKDCGAVRMTAAVFGLTGASFLFFDNLNRLLYDKQDFLQNQFFYYIEARRTALGEIFYTFMRCVPLLGVLWLVFFCKKRELPEKMFASAVLLLWTVSKVCEKSAFLRRYDADMPLLAVFAVCLVIFVAWRRRKVYTDS